MATRPLFNAIGSRIDSSGVPGLPGGSLDLPQGRDLARLVWKAIFFPYWVWSDMPAPALPKRNPPLPPCGEAGAEVVQALDRVARRAWLQWGITLLARAAWLGLLVAVFWLAVEVGGGPAVDYRALVWLFGALFIPAMVLAIASRPSRERVAAMLDRSFGLQERVVTALGNLGEGLPAQRRPAGLQYLQVADTANALMVIRNDRALRIALPVRELMLVVVCALLFATLFFLRGGRDEVPHVEVMSVPSFVPAAQRFVAAPEQATLADRQPLDSNGEPVPLSDEFSDTRRDLAALAEAMQNHAFTRPAAAAIERGDYASAGQILTDIAPDAATLSDVERAALASDLSQAANAMSGEGQPLRSAAAQAAEGLREGGQAAEQGVDALGAAVDQAAATMAEAQAGGDTDADAGENASQSIGQASSQAPSPGNSLFDQTTESEPSLEEAGGIDGGAQPGGSSGEGGPQGGQAQQPGDPAQQGNAPGERQGQQGGDSSGAAAEAGTEGQSMSDQTGYVEPEMSTGQEAPAGSSASGSTGSGAGNESSSDGETSGSDAPVSQQPGGGAPSDPEVSTGVMPEEGGDGSSLAPRQAITLTQSDAGEYVHTGGQSDNARLGSGSGSAGATGSSNQSPIGEAGPDSNHVPATYRSIVEAYFTPPER
jgi:hypothetical protein